MNIRVSDKLSLGKDILWNIYSALSLNFAREIEDDVIESLLDYDYADVPHEHPSTVYLIQFIAAFRKKHWSPKKGAFRTEEDAKNELRRNGEWIDHGMRTSSAYLAVMNNSRKLQLMAEGRTDWRWFLSMWYEPNSPLKIFSKKQPKGSKFSFERASKIFESLPTVVPVRNYIENSFEELKDELADDVDNQVRKTLEAKGYKLK